MASTSPPGHDAGNALSGSTVRVLVRAETLAGASYNGSYSGQVKRSFQGV